MPWEMKLLYCICGHSVSGEIDLYAMAQTKHPCFASCQTSLALESLHGLNAAVEQIHGVQHGFYACSTPVSESLPSGKAQKCLFIVNN